MTITSQTHGWNDLRGEKQAKRKNALPDSYCAERLLRWLRAKSRWLNRESLCELLTACIALWNTVQLERAVQLLRDRGEIVPDALLEHVSPLAWEHINLTGDYVWRSRVEGK